MSTSNVSYKYLYILSVSISKSIPIFIFISIYIWIWMWIWIWIWIWITVSSFYFHLSHPSSYYHPLSLRWQVILSCFNLAPQLRPTFDQLFNKLEEYHTGSYQTVNKPAYAPPSVPSSPFSNNNTPQYPLPIKNNNNNNNNLIYSPSDNIYNTQM